MRTMIDESNVVAAPGFTMREDRGAEGETETPKASRGGKWGGGFPTPQPTIGSLGERRKLPSGVRDGAPPKNDFSTFSACLW